MLAGTHSSTVKTSGDLALSFRSRWPRFRFRRSGIAREIRDAGSGGQRSPSGSNQECNPEKQAKPKKEPHCPGRVANPLSRLTALLNLLLRCPPPPRLQRDRPVPLTQKRQVDESLSIHCPRLAHRKMRASVMRKLITQLYWHLRFVRGSSSFKLRNKYGKLLRKSKAYSTKPQSERLTEFEE